MHSNVCGLKKRRISSEDLDVDIDDLLNSTTEPMAKKAAPTPKTKPKTKPKNEVKPEPKPEPEFKAPAATKPEPEAPVAIPTSI